MDTVFLDDESVLPSGGIAIVHTYGVEQAKKLLAEKCREAGIEMNETEADYHAGCLARYAMRYGSFPDFSITKPATKGQGEV